MTTTAVDEVVNKAKKSRKNQLIVIAFMAIGFALYGYLYGKTPLHGVAALYGGFVSLFISWTLGLGVIKATELAKDDPKVAMGILYGSAVLRFVLMLVLFGVGMGLLGLNPIPLVLTAIVTWITGVVAVR
ncbi:MAG: ATP synthase subunit I [Cocleimonas sp.]|nr:ATP synthase subunit I [Cocleimonas sp.]